MRRPPKVQNLSPSAHAGLQLRLLGVGLALGCWIGTASEAVALSNPISAAGQWDITLADSNRSCRMTLRADETGSAAVSMPAGCRRALPILANVGTFEIPRADHIALADQTGKPVLDFAGDGRLSFIANGPEGETYHLVAISGAFVQSERVAQAASPKPPGFQTVETKPGEGGAMPSRITSAMKPGDLAGRYAVLRDENKDTGCMITLDDKTRAAKGGFKATLAPACRDQGIVIFDPMGWQLAGGRLVLTARKGHTTHLDLQQDSTWAKDPKEGKALSLKKLQ
jgi:hypothetical protein